MLLVYVDDHFGGVALEGRVWPLSLVATLRATAAS